MLLPTPELRQHAIAFSRGAARSFIETWYHLAKAITFGGSCDTRQYGYSRMRQPPTPALTMLLMLALSVSAACSSSGSKGSPTASSAALTVVATTTQVTDMA